MTDSFSFNVNLEVHVDPDNADTILKAANDEGVDEGVLTLQKAVVVLVNAGNYEHFSHWNAGPFTDTTLLDLALAKLAEHDIDYTKLSNTYTDPDTEQDTFPHDRYFAVEIGTDLTYWAFGGSTPEDLADAMDQSEVQPGRLMFVTDLLTGRDLEAGLKLTFP